MNMLFISQILALLGLLAGVWGLYIRYVRLKARALGVDRSRLKGSPGQGVWYAFTLGMMPWAKESTRLHLIAYTRGIFFHISIFAALGLLFVSPFWNLVPALLKLQLPLMIVLTAGALLGAAGGVTRIAEHNLRGLSTSDDHFAVWLLSFWLALSALVVWTRDALVAYYLVSALMLAYLPLGKVRHCLYFFFSRTFFGRFFGRRAVYPHPLPIQEGLP